VCTREQLPEPYQKLVDRVQTLEALLEEQGQHQNRLPTQPNRSTASSAITSPSSSATFVPSVLRNTRTPSFRSNIVSSDDQTSGLIAGTASSTRILPTISASNTADDRDAAQILEFLAWGRRKDQTFDNTPENESGPHRRLSAIEDATTSDFSSPFMKNTRLPQLEVLELLLPSRSLLEKLVDFHSRCLVWYHGSYNTVTFHTELSAFYADYHGRLTNPNLNLQWIGLLFAVITGGITCASASIASSWGFQEVERSKLMQEWYKATISCLNLSDYLANHTIYSVQTICTLTISAHIIGMSNSQSVLLASANRIAQSLGLHRLGPEPELNDSATRSSASLIRRETGRRVWCQLCTQDWFSIPFSESYALNPRFFDTAMPLNCNDDDSTQIPLNIPTMTSYCNYLYQIAILMPQLQDSMFSSNTDFTKYEHVLAYDEKMRQLTTRYMPTFLSTSTSEITQMLPGFTVWARRSLAICAAHKIIMIHRKFLGLSFTNSAFGFTRRTCVAASKTILKEAKAAVDHNGPVLWIDQAFSVAAGIILCLDAYHRERNETEYEMHIQLASEAIQYLSQFKLSKIASRGITLLSFLVDGLHSVTETSNSRKRSHPQEVGDHAKRRKAFDFSTFMKSMSAPTPAESELENMSPSGLAWDAFAELLPPQTGFGGEDMLMDLFDFQM
jgi:hypothetical protein